MSVYSITPGTKLYKYLLLRELGSSQSDVWLAEDTTTKQQVALKVMDAVRAPVAQRLWEAKVGARFRHTNLCEVFYADVIDIGGTNFVTIAYRFCQKGTCEKQLQGPGVLPAKDVQRLLLDVLAGLEYLHSNGCIHNDIKPANILIGDHGEYLLTDYGISSDPTSGAAPALFYVPHVSPETAGATAHVPCELTDIYQLGLTAYRLLNGVNRVRDEFNRLGNVEFSRRVAAGKIPDRSGYDCTVHQKLKRIVNRAIAVDPNKRYQSALQMRRDLERISIDRQWTYGASGSLECVASTCTYTIITEPIPRGRTYVKCMRKMHKSGKLSIVHAASKKCTTQNEIMQCKSEIHQWVLNNG